MKVRRIIPIWKRWSWCTPFTHEIDELIIKPADKGSAVVVWSNHDYLLEAKSQLHNTKVYEKWSGNPFQKVKNESKSVLRDKFNRKEIDKK